MRLHPVVAFVVTALVMTVVLGGVMIWMVWGHPSNDREFDDFRWSVLPGLLTVSFLYVTGSGLFVGLPFLAVLKWMGRSERWWALVLSGFVGGALIMIVAALVSGPLALNILEPAAIVGGFGMAAGLMWWLLTCGAAPADRRA